VAAKKSLSASSVDRSAGPAGVPSMTRAISEPSSSMKHVSPIQPGNSDSRWLSAWLTRSSSGPPAATLSRTLPGAS
jgi:hypothetical protein